MNQSNVTTIEWYTLPRNGNGGAAIVRWRASTSDTYDAFFRDYHGLQYNALSYLLGDKPPRYGLPCLIGEQSISTHGVVLFVADEKIDAVVKWWRRDYGHHRPN